MVMDGVYSSDGGRRWHWVQQYRELKVIMFLKIGFQGPGISGLVLSQRKELIL